MEKAEDIQQSHAVDASSAPTVRRSDVTRSGATGSDSTIRKYVYVQQWVPFYENWCQLRSWEIIDAEWHLQMNQQQYYERAEKRPAFCMTYNSPEQIILYCADDAESIMRYCQKKNPETLYRLKHINDHIKIVRLYRSCPECSKNWSEKEYEFQYCQYCKHPYYQGGEFQPDLSANYFSPNESARLNRSSD